MPNFKPSSELKFDYILLVSFISFLMLKRCKLKSGTDRSVDRLQIWQELSQCRWAQHVHVQVKGH